MGFITEINLQIVRFLIILYITGWSTWSICLIYQRNHILRSGLTLSRKESGFRVLLLRPVTKNISLTWRLFRERYSPVYMNVTVPVCWSRMYVLFCSLPEKSIKESGKPYSKSRKCFWLSTTGWQSLPENYCWSLQKGENR